jgi:hypothetical protein
VWAVLVVVLDVAAQDADKVLAADNQRVVEALPADCSDPSLGDGVGVGRLDRCADDLGTGRTPDIVECPGELRVSVADQEVERGGTVAEVEEEVAGLLGHPRPGRVGGDTGKVHLPAAQFDDEQHIQSAQEHGVDREEVARQDASRLSAQERPPGGRSPPRCWIPLARSTRLIELAETWQPRRSSSPPIRW